MKRAIFIGALILLIVSACEKEDGIPKDLTSGFVGTFYYDEYFSDIVDTIVVERVDDITLLIKDFQHFPDFEATASVSAYEDWPAIDLSVPEQTFNIGDTSITLVGFDRIADRPGVHGLIERYDECYNNKPCLDLGLYIMSGGIEYSFSGANPL